MIELFEGVPPLAGVHPMRAIFMIPNMPPPNFKHPEKSSADMLDFLAQCVVKDPSSRFVVFSFRD